MFDVCSRFTRTRGVAGRRRLRGQKEPMDLLKPPHPAARLLSRRDVLHAGVLAALGSALALPTQAAAARDVRCIFLVLVGGPSQQDTWDPKPDAPSEVRGPFAPIATSVAGVRVSELFPRIGKQAHHIAFVRSMHHTGPASHDESLQMIQAGYPSKGGSAHWRVDLPASADGPVSSSESIGGVREALSLQREREHTRERYGLTAFGENCLRARRLVERGARFVAVPMFATVFNQPTWDIHGAAPFTSMAVFRNGIAPQFDMAYSALLEDLAQRGMLRDTLVVATGEFGRAPRINACGGRDHWPHCWTMLLAGGGVRGGQVVGASDKMGAYPVERPVTPADLTATLRYALGVPSDDAVAGPEGRSLRPVDRGVQPLVEVF